MGETLPKAETFGCLVAGATYEQRPAAYAVIRDSKGRVAAVKGRLGYFLPGGGAEANESPEATVEREIREELARNARLVGKLGEAFEYFSVDERYYQMPAVFFAAEFTSEPQGEGEYELCWLEASEIDRAFFYQCHAWAATQL